jgi:hypothetical protein
MSQRRVAAASIAGLLIRAGAVLSRFATTVWLGSRERYHPENHYMRGPGPKWRKKYGSLRTESDLPGR